MGKSFVNGDLRPSPRASHNAADFERAFAFLDDDTIDAFPANDLARGLRPIADVFVSEEASAVIRCA